MTVKSRVIEMATSPLMLGSHVVLWVVTLGLCGAIWLLYRRLGGSHGKRALELKTSLYQAKRISPGRTGLTNPDRVGKSTNVSARSQNHDDTASKIVLSINGNLRPLDNESLHRHRSEYQNLGWTVIDSVLDAQFAETLRAYLVSDLSPARWSLFALPAEKNHQPVLESNAESRLAAWKSAEAAVDADFSCRFYRTGPHAPECDCVECGFRSFLGSRVMMDYIRSITLSEINRPGQIFASKYSAGCFLSSHTDVDAGTVAFVFNLTKEWRIHWGGMFHFVHPSGRGFKDSVFPEFNRLLLFDVSKNGTPHLVSRVADGVKHSRLAFSGWYR